MADAILRVVRVGARLNRDLASDGVLSAVWTGLVREGWAAGNRRAFGCDVRILMSSNLAVTLLEFADLLLLFGRQLEGLAALVTAFLPRSRVRWRGLNGCGRSGRGGRVRSLDLVGVRSSERFRRQLDAIFRQTRDDVRCGRRGSCVRRVGT